MMLSWMLRRSWAARYGDPGTEMLAVLKGAATLDGEWWTVTEENKVGFRFFKVVVELP